MVPGVEQVAAATFLRMQPRHLCGLLDETRAGIRLGRETLGKQRCSSFSYAHVGSEVFQQRVNALVTESPSSPHPRQMLGWYPNLLILPPPRALNTDRSASWHGMFTVSQRWPEHRAGRCWLFQIHARGRGRHSIKATRLKAGTPAPRLSSLFRLSSSPRIGAGR